MRIDFWTKIQNIQNPNRGKKILVQESEREHYAKINTQIICANRVPFFGSRNGLKKWQIADPNGLDEAMNTLNPIFKDHRVLPEPEHRRLLGIHEKGKKHLKTEREINATERELLEKIREWHFFKVKKPGERSPEELQEMKNGIEDLLRTLCKLKKEAPKGKIVEKKAREAKQARDKMAMHNLRLLLARAHKKIGHGVPAMDLVQEGAQGLLKTVDRFNLERQTKFDTYATWWIDQREQRAKDDQSRTIRIPVHARTVISAVVRAEEELFKELEGGQPTDDEFTKRVNIIIAKSRRKNAIKRLVKMARNSGIKAQNYEPAEEQIEEMIKKMKLKEFKEARVSTGRKLEEKLGRKPSEEEVDNVILAIPDFTQDDLNNVRKFAHVNKSIDSPIKEGEDGEKTFIDIFDPSSETEIPDFLAREILLKALNSSTTEEADGIAEKEDEEDGEKKVKLKAREILILRYRNGLWDDEHPCPTGDSSPKTLDEVKKIFKVSRERIRQIELRAIGKLKKKLKIESSDMTKFILQGASERERIRISDSRKIPVERYREYSIEHKVMTFLADLPLQERKIIILRYNFDGKGRKTVYQIARELGIKVSDVRKTLSNIIDK